MSASRSTPDGAPSLTSPLRKGEDGSHPRLPSAAEARGEAERALAAAVYLRRGRFTLDVALGVPAGVTALLGPSGAGKSLTLQAIAGLAEIEDGWVTLNGRALTRTAAGIALSPRLRRVGYVPQNYALFPHLSVAGNIAYGLPRRLDRAARLRRVGDLLALGRLEGYERRRPRDLSGGEAQRVAVVRALAAEPEALLLDEPFSALDAPTRAAVRGDLGALIGASGLPALLVTHDLAEALALAARLALLVDGRIATAGEAAEALATPPTQRAARLLGWPAALDVAGAGRGAAERPGDPDFRVTLACGQTLILHGGAGCERPSEVAAEAAEALAANGPAAVALAVRPDRLLIARALDGPGGADGALDDMDAARGVFRGRIAPSGPEGDAMVLLETREGGEPDGAASLALGLAPRERAALGLADGDRVILRPLEGALRLVARL